MFNGDENTDPEAHPFIKILETPAPPRPLLACYLQPLSWSLIGFGSVFIFNLFAKKPMFAGIQRHFGMGAAGWLSGMGVQRWLDSNMSETDAVLKHYIMLHPEDFPVPERKRFGELLEPWNPIR